MKFAPNHGHYLHHEMYRMCDVLSVNATFARQALGEQHVANLMQAATTAITEALCALTDLQQDSL